MPTDSPCSGQWSGIQGLSKFWQSAAGKRTKADVVAWVAKDMKGERRSRVPWSYLSDKVFGNIVDVSSALPSADMDTLIPALEEPGIVVSASDIPDFAEDLDGAKYSALKEQYSAYFSKMTSRLFSSAISTQATYCIFPRKIHRQKT